MENKNFACRIFKEQIELILQLPENERAEVLYKSVLFGFNQIDCQFDNQNENQNESAYVSVSDSVSILSNKIFNLLKKNITWKEFSNNYGGSRKGAGAPKGNTNAKKNNQIDCQNDNQNDCKKIDFDTPFQAGGQLWTLPPDFRKLALTKYTESEIREFEKAHSCHENPEDVCLNDIKHQPKPTTTRFVKPTVEEIAAYCEERNNGINAEYFFDSYEGKGWLIGKTPMKDWKAAVRTWEKRTPKPQTTTSVNFTELVALWNDMASRLKLQPVSESDLMPERKAEIEKIVATKKPKDLKTLIAQLEQVIKKSPKLLGRQDEIGDDGRWFTKELGWQASFAFCFSTKGWSDIMAGKYNGEMK